MCILMYALYTCVHTHIYFAIYVCIYIHNVHVYIVVYSFDLYVLFHTEKANSHRKDEIDARTVSMEDDLSDSFLAPNFTVIEVEDIEMGELK